MKACFILLCSAASLAAAQLSNSAIISGVVVGADDQPVAGAIIHPWSEPAHSVRSGDDGHFEIVLDSASFRYSELLARSEDGTLQGTWFNDDADQQTVKHRETVRITVRPSVPLDITVKDSQGNPLPQAEVGVEAYHGFITTTTTGRDGHAHVRLPSDIRVRQVLAVKASLGMDYYDNTRSMKWLDTHPMPTEVTLQLRPSKTCRIKARNRQGNPVAGIAFYPWTIHVPDRPNYVNVSSAPSALGLERTTDPQGIATFDYLPADIEGSIALLCGSREWHQPDLAVWSPDDHLTDSIPELKAAVFQTVEAKGRVFLPDGQPASGILLQAEGRGKTDNYCRELARTGTDGSFRFLLSPEQSYLMAVTDLDLAAPSISGLIMHENEPRENLRISLTKGTLVTGIVTDSTTGKPLAGTPITFIEHGSRIDESSLRIKSDVSLTDKEDELVRWATTDAQGHYEMRVGKGRFTVSANYRTEKDITVGSEPNVTLDFKVAPME